MDVNQGIVHLLTEFGGSSIEQNGWVIEDATDKQTDAGNDNTQRPKLASGNKDLKMNYICMHTVQGWGLLK